MRLSTFLLSCVAATSVANPTPQLNGTPELEARDFSAVSRAAQDVRQAITQIQNLLGSVETSIKRARNDWPRGAARHSLDRHWGRMFAGWDGTTRPAMQHIADGFAKVAAIYQMNQPFPDWEIFD